MARKKKTVGEHMREDVVPKRRTARRKKAVQDVLSGKTGNKASLGKKKKSGMANQKDMDHAASQCGYADCKKHK